ncbi:histamine N-methyltransferase-like isoform X2 [Salvelinus fontinalis]|uniref:histamine N-methyltransferase-like isoform X2 n=1 Tax=Salvelinus fontinalis TaxID=8038 RepID=UPI002485C9BB|nr:histamine N-methyltransferase-like isoform X2 [Salvelinus fontinalis]
MNRPVLCIQTVCLVILLGTESTLPEGAREGFQVYSGEASHFSVHYSKAAAMNTVMPAGYEGRYVQGFQFYLKHSEEHKAIREFVDKVLPGEFTRIGEGKSKMDVLGVGSGGALVKKTPSLQKIPFSWHTMTCGEYEKQVKDKREIKRFDFIHMIQMLYYVDDYPGTIKFFHNLLKENSKLLIVHEAAGSGWETLWKTHRKELCTKSVSDYLSAGDIKVHLERLGLKYDEHLIPNTMDITDCFTNGDEMGELLLDFMTDQDHFHQSLTPDLRASILDLLRNRCSTEKEGRILFDCSFSCLLVYS